jgi:radical SAM protein with 4Fe4S-binding SPASM domain
MLKKSLYKTPLRKYLPVGDMTIETASYCNLRCRGCYHTLHEYPSKNRYMSFEDFKVYIDQLPNSYTLILHGLGEPTLNPNLGEMIKYAKDSKKFKSISFTTNALAKKPDIFEKLFSHGLDFIVVSVDSLNQEEADKLRAGTSVGLLIENIKYLINKFPNKIGIRMVISKVNRDTFQQTVEKLAAIGVKSIGFQPYDDHGDSRICLSLEEKEGITEKIKNLNVKGINLNLESMCEHKPIPCYSLYYSPVITVDGYLTPCCRVLDKEVFNLGNLKEVPFKKIFFSEKVHNLQKAIKTGKYPFFCRRCPLNHSELTQ